MAFHPVTIIKAVAYIYYNHLKNDFKKKKFIFFSFYNIHEHVSGDSFHFVYENKNRKDMKATGYKYEVPDTNPKALDIRYHKD